MPQDVLFAMLANFGAPPHLLRFIERMSADLQVAFELGGEPVAVPCKLGAKQGYPLGPALFLYAMKAFLESLDRDIPEEVKLQFRTNKRAGERAGKTFGTGRTNQGGFTFTFWAPLYAHDAAAPVAFRAFLLAATNAIYCHLKKFGLIIHVGFPGKRRKRRQFTARRGFKSRCFSPMGAFGWARPPIVLTHISLIDGFCRLWAHIARSASSIEEL